MHPPAPIGQPVSLRHAAHLAGIVSVSGINPSPTAAHDVADGSVAETQVWVARSHIEPSPHELEPMPHPDAQYPPKIDAGLSGKPDIARVIISGPGPTNLSKMVSITVIPGADTVGNTIAGASRAQNAFSRPSVAQSESRLHIHIVTLSELGSV